MLGGCGVSGLVIIVLDPGRADADLGAGRIPCRSCEQPLSPWGYARTRVVNGPAGHRVRVRPRRARCRGCGTTTVLFPAQLVPRCPVTMDVVGEVLMAAVQGAGHRVIAAQLSLPVATVRRWLRHLRSNAEWLRARGTAMAHQLDPNLSPLLPQPTALALAVDALGAAASAAVRIVGPQAAPSPWPVVCVVTGGRLLAGQPRSG